MRRVKRWLQFTILDWFISCALLAGGYACYCSLYADYIIEQKFLQSLRAHSLNVHSDFDEGPPQSRNNFHPVDVPYDWFWDLFRVPLEKRPYRRTSLEKGIYFISSGPEDADAAPASRPSQAISREPLSLVTQFRNLETCKLSFSDYDQKTLLLASSLAALGSMPASTSLEISIDAYMLHEEQLRALGRIPALRSIAIDDAEHFDGEGLKYLLPIMSLELRNAGLSEAGLQSIAKLPSLKTFSIRTDAAMPRNEWKSLRNVTSLNIDSTRLDDEALARILQIQNLQSLTIRAEKVSRNGWKELASVQQLESLSIQADTFTDDSISELRALPRLKNLWLDSINITQAAIPHLKELRSLERVMIYPTQFLRTHGGSFGFSAIPIDPAVGITPENEKEILRQMTASWFNSE